MPDFSVSLPKELAYDQTLPSLPAGAVSLDQYLAPVNGSSFATATQGTQIIFDLPARGFLIPSSLYLRYTYTITNSTTAFSSVMLGCPAYAPIQRLETYVNSQVIEQINNYNQTMTAMVNLTYDVAQKYGVQNMLGFGNNTTTQTLDSLDGRPCITSETGTFACPLWGILANCEKYVPMGMMPATRVVLTLDKLTSFIQQNGYSGSLTQESPSAFTMTNVELCYTMLDFPTGVNEIVKSYGEKFLLKSQSITNSSNSLSLAASGYTELIFNQRLASIKALFLLFPITGALTSLNGLFDSFEITRGGNYQFSVGGRYLPQKPLDATLNKTSVYMELRKAISAANSTSANFSINSVEFNRNPASTTTVADPAKFIIGTNLETLQGSHSVLLSGTSTQSTPISVRMNIATATAGVSSAVTLLSLYDAIIEVNPHEKSVIVRQ